MRNREENERVKERRHTGGSDEWKREDIGQDTRIRNGENRDRREKKKQGQR